MKLSFSTNGWNGRTFPDFVALAKALGFSGLELHDVLHTGWTAEGAPFHPQNAGRRWRRSGGRPPALPV